MSIEYKTKEAALKDGFIYAGRKDLSILNFNEMKNNKEIEEIKDFSLFILSEKKDLKDATMFQFVNNKGYIAKILSSSFRDGFDLWLIADNMAHRV